MYSLVFKYKEKSIYAFKDKWRINIGHYNNKDNKIYSKEEIEKIINTDLINSLIESGERNHISQDSFRIIVRFVSPVSDINMYRAWRGQYRPYIYLMNCYYRFFVLEFKNPRCFEFESIRSLLTGRYKVYLDSCIIAFPKLENFSFRSGNLIENIDSCYKDIIETVEKSRKETLLRKKTKKTVSWLK